MPAVNGNKMVKKK